MTPTPRSTRPQTSPAARFAPVRGSVSAGAELGAAVLSSDEEEVLECCAGEAGDGLTGPDDVDALELADDSVDDGLAGDVDALELGDDCEADGLAGDDAELCPRTVLPGDAVPVVFLPVGEAAASTMIVPCMNGWI